MMYLAAWVLTGWLFLFVSLPLSTNRRGPTPFNVLFYAAIGPITILVFLWWTNSGDDSKLKGWLDKPLW